MEEAMQQPWEGHHKDAGGEDFAQFPEEVESVTTLPFGYTAVAKDDGTIDVYDETGTYAHTLPAGCIVRHYTEPKTAPQAEPEFSGNVPYRVELLQKGIELTTGNRARTHGDWVENHQTIASLWSTYLQRPISAHDVCMLMTLVKVSRVANGSFNPDDYIDGAMYFAGAAECHVKESESGKA